MDVVGRIFALLSDPVVCDQDDIQSAVEAEHAFMMMLNNDVEEMIRDRDSAPNSDAPKMSQTFITTAMYLYTPSKIPLPFSAIAGSLAEGFMQISTDLIDTSTTRRFIECGVHLYLHAQKPGETLIPSFVFSASFRSCALLWNRCFEQRLPELKRNKLVCRRLRGCKDLCKQVFDRAPERLREIMASDNSGSITFTLQLSSNILQGNLPDEPRQIVSDMVMFMKQFQHYLPLNVEMAYPKSYKDLMEKLVINTQPTEVAVTALELIVTALLNSTDQYGWVTAIGDGDSIAELFLSQLLSCNMQQESEGPFGLPALGWKSDKLYFATKAIYAYKPGVPGIEALLDTDSLSLIVKLLCRTADSKISLYSTREILMIVKAVSRVPANCTGLKDEGLDDVLCMLSESTDKETKTFIGSISRQMNAVLSGEDLLVEPEIKNGSVDLLWENSPHPDDSNGTIALIDSILEMLDQLIEKANPGEQSVSEVVMMEAFVNALSFFWQSEPQEQMAMTHLFGDKYMECLRRVNYVMHGNLVQRNVNHGVLVQDMARTSEYFCEKAIVSGFIEHILLRLPLYLQRSFSNVTQAQLENELILLFYCAQITKFHYDPFGEQQVIDKLSFATKLPFPSTRLIARLIISSLFRVTEGHHINLLQVTKEEVDLLCSYITYPRPPECLDSAKLFMAASVLLRESTSHSVCVTSCLNIAKQAKNVILQNCGNDILEGALCLLLTLCHTPTIALSMSQEQNLIQLLTWLQHSPCSALSFPSRSVLWQLGHGMYQDPTECLYHAYTYLRYGSYAECIDWCKHASQLLKSVQARSEGSLTFNQPILQNIQLASIAIVRGIAHAHIFRHLMWQSISETKHDLSVKYKGGDLVDQSAISARDAVRELGFALDQGMLDEEGSYFMDMAMIYYGFIRKQVKDCNRCLLCRRKGVKLKSSHIIPRFLLKEVAPTMYTTCGKFTKSTYNTFGVVKLLCGRCEQCLSQNGEHQFQEKFMPVVHSLSKEDQTVEYDSNLYNFAVGIIFRSFLHNIYLFAYPNVREIYSTIIPSRSHLLSLPTNYDKETKIADPPPVIGLTPPPPLEAYLILNPFIMHLQNPALGPLMAAMFCSTAVRHLYTPLSGGPQTKYGHSILVRMSVCNVIVPLSLEPSSTLEEAFHINPQGGVYKVLSDNNRWKSTPRAIFNIILQQAEFTRMQSEKVTSGLAALQRDSKSADDYTQLYSSEVGVEEIDSKALQSLPKEEARLVSKFVHHQSKFGVALLPEGFDLKKEHFFKHNLDLPEGYVLLYHIPINNEQKKNVLYFIACSEHISAGQINVLIDDQRKIEGVCMQIKDYLGSSFVCVTGYLREAKTETRLEIKHSELDAASDGIKKAINDLMQRCGQPHAFLCHANMQIRQQGKVSLDHKCFESDDTSYRDHCPYCMFRCHICMEPASMGHSLWPHKETMKFDHCSKECKAIVGEHQIHLRHHSILHEGYGHMSLALVSIQGCLETFLSAYTIVQVYIAVHVPHQSSIPTCGRPYATVHLKTHKEHYCFSVYLADDFTAVEPMYTFPANFHFQVFKDSNILTQLFQKATSISSISQLIIRCIEMEPSVAKHICLTLSSQSRIPYVDIISSMDGHQTREILCSDWMLEEMTAHNDSIPPPSIDCSLSCLLPSVNIIPHLFWDNLQLVCLLWKPIVMGERNGSKNLAQKLEYFVRILKLVYEQAPVNLQDRISDQFCSRSDVILLCGRLAFTVLQGGISLSLEESVVNFLILSHKFVATLAAGSDILSSAVIQSLCQCFKETSNTDIQSNTKASGVAQHFIITLLLLSLHTTTVESDEKLQHLLAFAKKIMKSPFAMVVFMARAATAYLESCLHVESTSVITDGLDKEIDYLARIIDRNCQDHVKRRYYLKTVIIALTLLCSNERCISHLTNHTIVNELQMFLESAEELEDITANLIYKIITGEGEIERIKVKTASGRGTYEASVDLSLQVDHGLCCVFDKLLMIITEFNHLYLDCMQIPQCEAHTHSTIAVFLNELHRVLEKDEREALTQSLLKNITILKMFGHAISKKRWIFSFVPNGSNVRKSFEELLIIWTDCSKAVCQALAGVGGLKDIADNLRWALKFEVLTDVDAECLQNQLCIIFKCAMQIPLQTAFQLKDSNFQSLLHCSFVSVRVQSKFLLAILSKHLEVRNVRDLSLQKDEVVYVAHCLSNLMRCKSDCWMPNDKSVFSSINEIIHSLQCLSSLPIDKTHLVQSQLIDTMITLSSYKDKAYARQAFEVIWDLFMDPKVAPKIASSVARHKSLIQNLQQLFCLHCGTSSAMTYNAFVTLFSGSGNIEGAIDSMYTFACNMYKSSKFLYATALCYQIIDAADAANPRFWKAKCCMAKCFARLYFSKRTQHSLKGSNWDLPGYDVTSTGENGEKYWWPERLEYGSGILRKLSVESWMALCSEGLHVIELLGEVLNAKKLDVEGTQLLDWMMMDYSILTGALSECKRCLLCRKVGKLVRMRHPGCKSIMCLQSFMHTSTLQAYCLFCRDCFNTITKYQQISIKFLAEASNCYRTVPYDKDVFLSLVSHVIFSLPSAYSCTISNQQDIYDAYLACRNVILFPDKYKDKATLPSIYLIRYPKNWYAFNNNSSELCEMKDRCYVNAIIASQEEIRNGGDPHKCSYYLTHMGKMVLMIDFGSRQDLPSQCLMNPNGGSYPLLSRNEIWEAFHVSAMQVFENVTLAEDYIGTFHSVLTGNAKPLGLSDHSHFPSSARILLPAKRLISFLPEQFQVSNDIQGLSLPEGHVVIGHSYDAENDVTLILISSSDSDFQEDKVYFILTCKLWGYQLVESGELKTFLNIPKVFPLSSSVPGQSFYQVRYLLKKLCRLPFLRCLVRIFAKYGFFSLEGLSLYGSITRNVDLTVSVDSVCSTECCWYCKDRCRGCLKPGAIGYTHIPNEGLPCKYCSEMCYRIFTANVADSIVLDVTIGKKITSQPMKDTYLLLSSTVLLESGLARNTVVSAHLFVSYNHKSIPSGVACVHVQVCAPQWRSSSLPVIIQHNLVPVKSIQKLDKNNLAVQYLKKGAYIERVIVPALKKLEYKDLQQFLQVKFQSLSIKFMDTHGRAYELR